MPSIDIAMDYDVSPSFAEALNNWGPAANFATPSLPDAIKFCRDLATTHYENFPLASWLLPKSLHQHFFNVYAYCRWADDLSDEVHGDQQSLELLAWWRRELEDCYAGTARHPVFVALRSTIDEFDIPPEPFHHLIDAFEQDQRIHEYQTFEELRDYCRGSADPVGRLVLYMCQQFNDQNAEWSDSICTGLQLANFWQDVARDAVIGRTYLPKEDRERFGYSDEDLANKVTNQAFLDLMKFQVDRAKQHLLDGLPLVRHLPGRMQVDIELFARGGLKILERVEAIGYRVWDQRPKVTKWDAGRLFVGCVLRAVGRKLRILVV